MAPELVFFIIRGAIRVGATARQAYEQNVRDQDFTMPDLPFMPESLEMRFDRFFNQKDGTRGPLAALTMGDGPLKDCWIPGPSGGHPSPDPAKTARLFEALTTFQRQLALDGATDGALAALRTADEEALSGVLDQWSPEAKPVGPFGRIAVALAGVALDYVGSNPGILGVGGNGEALIRTLCDNLAMCLDRDALDGPEAYFVERMGVSILQAGLKTISENPGLVTTDKAVTALIGSVASPLARLFKDAAGNKDYAEQLRWINIRDTVMPRMVSAGLSVLAEHQQTFFGARFDPNDTLGYFTRGFLGALSETSVLKLGDAEAWVPIYHTMLRAVVARPNLLSKDTTPGASAAAIESLIKSLAGTLDKAPMPYSGETALDLGLLVIDELDKTLPKRTRDPWAKLAPSALKAVVEGLRSGATADMPQTALSAVLRVILGQAAATPGMIVGDGASVELQAIVAAVAAIVARDEKALISEQGWLRIAAVATAAAARNPGKLFRIDDATPDGQVATRLIEALLTKASAELGGGRSPDTVLFGDTLVETIESTLTSATGNAEKALENTDAMLALVDQLNRLLKDKPAKPGDRSIDAADWSWLYRTLIPDVLRTGKVEYTDDQLRTMLLARTSP